MWADRAHPLQPTDTTRSIDQTEGFELRKALIGALGVSLTAGFLAVVGTPALASPDDGHGPATKPATAIVDDLPNPLEDKRRELRKTAVSDVVSGRRDS